jgi:Protein of unknown function (DUF3501)
MTSPRPTKPLAITRADIMPMVDYAAIRSQQRKRISDMKRSRRIEVGPYSTFYFENYDTMWHQIHEMLFVEKGGEAQIQDELEAYNPLIPNGDELIATVMFEIPEAARRTAVLHMVGGIEHHMTLSIGGDTIRGEPDADRENTSAEGKASSVQFVRFTLTTQQKTAFKSVAPVMLGFDHPRYGHLAVLPPAIREALAQDLTV